MEEPGSSGINPGDGNSTGSSTVQGLEQAFEISVAVKDKAEPGINLSVDAVYLASVLAEQNAVITYGTLTPSGQSATWSPEPADRLVAHLDGKTYTIHIQTLEGELTNQEAFFNSEHHLRSTVSVDDTELTLESRRQNGTRFYTVQGQLPVDGVVYTVDLASSGTEYFEVDSTGSELRTSFTTQGSVQFDNMMLQLSETSQFELVSSGQTATSDTRTVNSSLMVGDTRYDFVNVTLKKAFFNGKPSEVDNFWRASGTITRDGEDYGALMLVNAGVNLDVVMQLPEKRLTLESWQAY